MTDIEKTRANDAAPRPDVAAADEALLASLGYKQEFKREFTGLEVRICILPLKSRSTRAHTINRHLGLRSASSGYSRQSRPYSQIRCQMEDQRRWSGAGSSRVFSSCSSECPWRSLQVQRLPLAGCVTRSTPPRLRPDADRNDTRVSAPTVVLLDALAVLSALAQSRGVDRRLCEHHRVHCGDCIDRLGMCGAGDGCCVDRFIESELLCDKWTSIVRALQILEFRTVLNGGLDSQWGVCGHRGFACGHLLSGHKDPRAASDSIRCPERLVCPSYYKGLGITLTRY